MILYFTNARVLLPHGALAETPIAVEDGRITAIDEAPPPGALTVDADGALLLPGIVDLHGDAFERQLMPRPGVDIAAPVALHETDRQMLSNGITTAFHAMTWSWEPGLRSRDAGLAFIRALTALRPELKCDTRLHFRHETFNLDGEDAVIGLIGDGLIDLLAINDHTPSMVKKAGEDAQDLASTADRSGLALPAFLDLLSAVHARADEVPASVERITAAARAANMPMASHDDYSPQIRASYDALGCRICEFPTNTETARAAREADAAVILGGPNVLRGGSHTGFVNAAEMVAEDMCDVLVSDYYYPSLPAAPFRLVADGICDFATAWKLVSTNPARAARLDDRGDISVGARADLVMIDDTLPSLPRVMATFVRGFCSLLRGRDWNGSPVLRRLPASR